MHHLQRKNPSVTSPLVFGLTSTTTCNQLPLNGTISAVLTLSVVGWTSFCLLSLALSSFCVIASYLFFPLPQTHHMYFFPTYLLRGCWFLHFGAWVAQFCCDCFVKLEWRWTCLRTVANGCERLRTVVNTSKRT